MLALLAVAELLGMSLWFAGSAVAPQLRDRWALSGSQVGWLTTAVQLGFVAGTALSALLNLADLVPARTLFAVSAFLGALANAWLAFAHGLPDAFVSRFVSGLCLAGVYPPAMKMASTWFRARRGLAVGTIVGALTIGKAGPLSHHRDSRCRRRVHHVARVGRGGGRRRGRANRLRGRTFCISLAAVLLESRRRRRPHATVAAGDRRLSRAHGRTVFVLDVDPRVRRGERRARCPRAHRRRRRRPLRCCHSA